MRRFLWAVSCVVMAVTLGVPAVRAEEALDLRRGVPEDVFLVVQAMHNPERDYQKKYYEEVWQTVEETQIVPRALQIITSRLGDDQLAMANGLWDELREATEPIDIAALAECQEMIYAQQMVMWRPEDRAPAMPTSQHLVLMRVTPDVAASTAEGLKNLFAMVERYSGGDIPVREEQVDGASLVTLALPAESPMQPTVACLDDVFMFCTSTALLKQSIGMMTGADGTSKFDDPRLAAALQELPPAEDSIVFYDGRSQFATLRKLGDSLTQIGGGDPNVERAVRILDIVMEHVSVIDYEVTVEYTEGNLNRSASYGKLIPGTDDMTLRRMLASGESFDEWQSWVPAGSLSYSLGSGVNLHVLYQAIMDLLDEEVPEAADGLEQFEAMQQQLDLHLDEDILQAFSGEYASVTVVTDQGRRESVMALRCHKPERIRELIHRGIEALQRIEWVRMQQLKLSETPDMEGFETVSAGLLTLAGASPVIGFQDGWMFIAPSAAAVQKVLETRAGEGETIEATEDFQRLNIDIEGPVRAISYANTAENLRGAADTLRKGSFVFQMIVMAAGGEIDNQTREVMEEVVALLPDVAKIVEKFDFLQAKVSVTQQGEDADSYTKRSVTVVRPADEDADAEEVEAEAEAEAEEQMEEESDN